MTHAERTHWLTALIITLAAGVLMYGVLFVQPWATLTAAVVSVIALIGMRRGWLPRRHR